LRRLFIVFNLTYQGNHMSITSASQDTSKFADKVADSAEHAIAATQHAANGALDNLSGKVQGIRNQAGPLIANVTGQATELLQSGRDAVRHASHQVTDAALHARDGAASYVKEEPVKALLIAAATGAALMALVSMMSHSRRSH
jgi:ElaB/YqjD/DUF883 family membrane-anchored ribosome-binding protein